MRVDQESTSESPVSQSSCSTSNTDSIWLHLASTARHVRKNGWEHREIPEELSRLPDGLAIPDGLQQILIWSRVPGSNWSFQPPKKSTNSLGIHDQSPKETDGGKMVATTALIQKQSGKLTPIPDNVSNSSFTTASTQLSPSTRGSPSDSEKSLRSKLLSKMKLSKPEERVSVEAVAVAECTSCFEEMPETEMILIKSCRHWYCKECLGTLITTAVATEASFPPKCCLSPLPLKQILRALNSQQRNDYQNKAAEYALPTTDRWYCPNKDCLKWIPKSKLRINRELGYNCPHCSAKVCRTCRGAAHDTGVDCPQDFGLEATLETANIEGWMRCFSCKALVEHNMGCRHMTCRCGAQFCYVCGKRWKTCRCEETDAVQKRARVEENKRTKVTRNAAEAAETAEMEAIARAIAEIEEMERREAEERRKAEAKRQKQEEELLLRLEAERLAEETRKQEEAEQAERDFRDALVKSFEDEWRIVNEIYQKIRSFQFVSINSRHEAEDVRLGRMNVVDEEKAKQEFDLQKQDLQSNVSSRRSILARRHKVEVEELGARQEDEEDDLFLQVQMQLRGKANKEKRMERMLNEIRKQQEEDRQELEGTQKAEMEAFEGNLYVDSEGLQRWYDCQVQQARYKQHVALQKFGHTVGADRQYFEIVTERCEKMLAIHAQNFLASLAAGEDAVGLTEYEASLVQPSLPEVDDGEQGPSGICRGQTQKSGHVDNLINETYDLYGGQTTPTQESHSQSRSYYQRPIPGAYPYDLEEINPYQPPHPTIPRILPPAAPRNQPPPPPSHAQPILPMPSTQLLTIPPLSPRQPRTPTTGHPQLRLNTTTTTTTTTNPPPLLQGLSRPKHQTQQPQTQPQFQFQSPFQTQPLQTSRQNNAPILPTTLHMASMAAAMVMPQVNIHAQSQYTPPTNSSSSSNKYRRPSQQSSSTASSTSALISTVGGTSKKSRWFRKEKDTTDEEIKRKMRGTVGDARGWNMDGVLGAC